MSVEFKLDDTQFNRRIAELAVVSSKGLQGAVKEAATRFTKSVVRNTPPMIAKTSPAQIKREWIARREKYFTKERRSKGKWLSKAEIKRLLAAKKKKLGREAAGWGRAVAELKTSVPAWVKRHPSGEGSILIRKGSDKYSITISNRVPYGQTLLQQRAEYSLAEVQRGLEGTIRVLKRKMIRQMK